MRGMSFGNSPLKKHKPGHVDLTKNKKGQPSASTDGKKRNVKAEKSVNDIGDAIDFLEEDYNNDRVSKSQYYAKMKILREKERVAIKANKS